MEFLPLLLEGAPNFRDFGGHAAIDGRRVRTGSLYRSELLLGLTQNDLDKLAALDIALVCDLRSPAERGRVSNEWPKHKPTKIVALDVGTDLSAVQPDRWAQRLADPDFTVEKAHAALRENYQRMPTSYARDLRALFEHFGQPDAKAILVHCAAGKDRTGFVVAMLLSALGVPRETIFADYLETNRRYSVDRLVNARARFLPNLEMTDTARAALRVLASVHLDFIEAAFDSVHSEFGSVERYLEQVCELTPARRDMLHTALLIPANA